MKEYQVIDWAEQRDPSRPPREEASQLQNLLNKKAEGGWILKEICPLATSDAPGVGYIILEREAR